MYCRVIPEEAQPIVRKFLEANNIPFETDWTEPTKRNPQSQFCILLMDEHYLAYKSHINNITGPVVSNTPVYHF